jgi:hypothetical protein
MVPQFGPQTNKGKEMHIFNGGHYILQGKHITILGITDSYVRSREIGTPYEFDCSLRFFRNEARPLYLQLIHNEPLTGVAKLKQTMKYWDRKQKQLNSERQKDNSHVVRNLR